MVDALVRQLVDMANANEARVDGTTEPVKRLIDGADVAIGIWQKRDGDVGLLILKGERVLREVIASGKPMPSSVITAIKCNDQEQAEMAKHFFGSDGLDA
jgi:hypothetical protein